MFIKFLHFDIHKYLSTVSFVLLIFSALFFATDSYTYAQQTLNHNLWISGRGGYKSYRIPSLIVAPNGDLLAFAEGRKSPGDSGNIDLLLKRSKNNGKTWSSTQIVWNNGDNTCGNPTAVVDKETGRIWLFMTWNYGEDTESQIIQKKSKYTRRVYVCYSDNNGKTWSKPKDITSSCKKPSWGWYATGPGIGIQVQHGKYKGRLLIPANHSFSKPGGKMFGHYVYADNIIYSDDHGKTWHLSHSLNDYLNENQLVELSDGTIMLNARNYNGKHCRAVSLSKDGGISWSKVTFDYQLVGPTCQASILNYGNYDGKDMLVFANPAVPISRTHMTVKVSFNQGKSWSNSKLIYAGPSAYSCLTKLPNGNIGLLFESGTTSQNQNIKFISFPPEEIFTPGSLIK